MTTIQPEDRKNGSSKNIVQFQLRACGKKEEKDIAHQGVFDVNLEGMTKDDAKRFLDTIKVTKGCDYDSGRSPKASDLGDIILKGPGDVEPMTYEEEPNHPIAGLNMSQLFSKAFNDIMNVKFKENKGEIRPILYKKISEVYEDFIRKAKAYSFHSILEVGLKEGGSLHKTSDGQTCIVSEVRLLNLVPEEKDYNHAYLLQKRTKYPLHDTDLLTSAILLHGEDLGKELPLMVPQPCAAFDFFGHRVLASLNYPKTEGGVSIQDAQRTVRTILLSCGLSSAKALEKVGVIKYAAYLSNDFNLSVRFPNDEQPVFRMRSEFLRRYYSTHNPLDLDSITEQKRVDLLTEYQKTIPEETANKLFSLKCTIFQEHLTVLVHQCGLNLRDLGTVYKKLIERMRDTDNEEDKKNCNSWANRILVEIAARSFRRVVNEILYRCAVDGTILSEVKKRAAKRFNEALIENKAEIWERINEWKDKCFPDMKDLVLSYKLLFEEKLKEDSFIPSTFLRISSSLLGMKWAQELEGFPDMRNEGKVKVFNITLIVSMNPRALEMNLAHHAHGVAIQDILDSKIAQGECLASFLQALERQPTNVRSLDRLARVYKDLQKGEQDKRKSDVFHQKEEFLIKLAQNLQDANADTFLSYAFFLYRNALNEGDIEKRKEGLKDARDKFSDTLAKDNNHQHAWMMWADFEFYFADDKSKVVKHILSRAPSEPMGNNGIFHLLFYKLLNKEWDSAAKLASTLRRRVLSKDDPRSRPDDQYFHAHIDALERAICDGFGFELPPMPVG